MHNPIESETATVSDNYLDVKHEYQGLPNADGMRVRFVDVWFAVRPSAPSYDVVDNQGKPIPGGGVNIETAWSLHKAGLNQLFIIDRDDINGLRKLLDVIEQDMDRRDLEALTREFDLDNDDEE